jgi:hypothetical protein
MSFLSAGSGQSAKPEYTGLQIQTSTSTLPIPVFWGRTKLSPNLIWTANFRANAQKQSAGKGGGSVTGYTYSADIIMGLCEGPLTTVAQVWKDSLIYASPAQVGLSLFTGTTPQAVWPYLAFLYPTQALGYAGTAFVCAADYDLGSSASLSNHNFEVINAFSGGGTNGTDADPAQVIGDFLLNQQYGVRFPAGSLDGTSLYSSAAASTTGDAALQTYLRAVSISFSPCLTDVETAQSVLQRWIKLLNTAVVVSGGKVRFIPYGDTPISGNGVTYVPNMTPVFTLDDDDFQGDSTADPVQGQITDPSEAYNVERLTINDRANEYNSVPIEARIEAAVNQYGLRVDTSVSATEICDAAVAAIVAQLILQRQLYVRNTYTIKLDARYCGLDPMDWLAFNETVMGMTGTAVRIVQIEEEDDTGVLTVQVEELPAGVATAVAYPKQTNGGLGNVQYAPASPVNPPIIFEPPPSMTNNEAQVWIGASGSIGGVADPQWGGANVYISSDNATYEFVGTITAPVRQGALLTALPAYAGGNPDSTDTLAVDMTQSGGALASAASAADAANGSTVCYVDGEVLSFQTATLTAANQYALTSLYRGQNGTTGSAHAAGTQFARLDGAFLVYDLPTAYVGQLIWVKLASFNGQGGGLQDLSNCIAYPYVPIGGGLFGQVASALSMGIPLDYGQVADAAVEFDDFGSVFDPVNIVIDLGTLT